MQLSYPLHPGTGIALCAAACLLFCQTPLAAQAPQTGAQPLGNAGVISKGLPPRATPNDYQAHAQVGPVTIAAEFAGHSFLTEKMSLAADDYVAVVIGIYGAPGAHANISTRDFSLRINESKKAPLQAQPYSLAYSSLKDPEWAPPESSDKSSSKTSFGGGDQKDPTAQPVPVHPPFALKRSWELEVQKGALPEGDRDLPVEGLVFFKYGGKEKNIDAIELIYESSNGKIVIPLHP